MVRRVADRLVRFVPVVPKYVSTRARCARASKADRTRGGKLDFS